MTWRAMLDECLEAAHRQCGLRARDVDFLLNLNMKHVRRGLPPTPKQVEKLSTLRGIIADWIAAKDSAIQRAASETLDLEYGEAKPRIDAILRSVGLRTSDFYAAREAVEVARNGMLQSRRAPV